MSETQTLEARLERWADAHEDLPECAYGAELARQATDELSQLRAEVARLREVLRQIEREARTGPTYYRDIASRALMADKGGEDA
jgi:hypothetical protein